MERLTGYDYIAGVRTGDLLVGVEPQKAYDRLAAYEDTGLEPEKIYRLCDMERRAKMADMLRLEEYQQLGTIARLRELAQADREGRCVVLPCKVGDTVWYLTGKPSLAAYPSFDRVESEKVAGFYLDEKGLQIRLRNFHGNHGTYGFFGKTVFLSPEAAEAAMKGEQDG